MRKADKKNIKKIATIVGTRPQFIKAAVVSREIAKVYQIQEIIVHTGQHYDANMSKIFFEELALPRPAYNLDIGSSNHGKQTGLMLQKIEEVLLKEEPDYVLLYGDTNSTLAGALAAVKLHIPIAHVEGGLRSYHLEYPEEVNRIVADQMSNVVFCPTRVSFQNLEKENVEKFGTKIILSGDVMQDAALFYSKKSSESSTIIKDYNLKEFILCTIHRAEITDDITILNSVINALNKIHNEVPVIVPLHPRTKKVVQKNDLKLNFKVIDPVGYLDMIELLKNCKLVITDSGGLQKEAFFFKKHCATIAKYPEMEWVELYDKGYNIFAGTDQDKIYKCYKKMLNRKSNFDEDLYGGGKAAKRIVKFLLNNI